MRELRVRLNKDSGEIALEGVDVITCREKLGGEIDMNGRCILRPSKLEEEK